MSQLCEICATREARYVCSRCGKRACERDFLPGRWLCTSCEPVARVGTLEPASVFPIGLSWIFFASFAMILIGMILMVAASMTQGQGVTSGGAVILIGPIPIVLGGGPESGWLILLGAIVTVVAIAAFLLARRKTYS
ncbi:TIGR00304 family membrane protein [[Eubacterium] cellulosolvens]